MLASEPVAGNELTSLDELLGAFIGALTVGEYGNWRAGTIVVRALALMPKGASKQHRARLIGQFAAAAPRPCTAARVRQLAAVSGTFGPEPGYPDHVWTYYRAVLCAAHRVSRNPVVLLDESVTADLSIGEINALGKPTPEYVKLSATCTACGTRATLRLDGDGVARAFSGAALPCPNCVAQAWADGGDGKTAERLGIWE